MTNADKIRQMSDDELCDFIHKTHSEIMLNLPWCKNDCTFACRYCMLEWLKEDVADDSGYQSQ